MSQAEDLLNSLSAAVIDHKHEVPDSDTYFLIDPYTRQIENTNYQKTVLMRGDHNSERFTFEVPRYVDGHDMSLCNRVIVHFDNVGDSIENVYSDVAYMEDLRINPDKPETVISSWLIRREATQIVGILSFSIQYQCVEGEEITYEWNTDSYDDIEIRKSKNNGEAAVINYTNVLEQWRSQIFGAGDTVMANIAAEGTNQVTAVQAESATQQAAIELKGSETLDTIPEDYTEVRNMAREAVRTKTDSVVCESEGDVIRLTDSSDDFIRGLNVYGKSIQFTTTGKNKLNLGEQHERVVNGVTLTPVYDSNGNLSYLNLKGTSLAMLIVLSVPFHLAAGSYIFTNFVNRTEEDHSLHAQICDSNNGLLYPQDKGLGGSFTFENDVDLVYRIYVDEGRVLNNEKIYPMLRDATIEDPTYEPYTGGVASPNPDYPQELVSIENPTVRITGKNLFDPTKLLEATDWVESNGEYIGSSVRLHDKFNYVNGEALCDTFKPNTQYTLSFNAYNEAESKGTGITFNYRYTDGTMTAIYPGDIVKTAYKFYSAPGKTIKALYASYGSNVTVHLSDIQLEEGTNATEYEPYVGSSIDLANTLRGIPIYDVSTQTGVPTDTAVDYTDVNGKQWACDMIDLERGIHIQRIGTYSIVGNENMSVSGDKWQKEGMFSVYMNFKSPASMYASDDVGVFHCSMSNKCMSNTWEWSRHDWLNNIAARKSIVYVSLDNTITGIVEEDTSETKLLKMKDYLAEQYNAGSPVTVQYILATPIETPLTAEEIEAYKSLKSNYPITTVLNNAGAWMKFKYNADTQIFLENLPKASNEQVNASVTAWLEAHYSEAEGASF